MELLRGPAAAPRGARPVCRDVDCVPALARDIHMLIGARVAQAIGMATVPRAVVRDLCTGAHAARILSLRGVVLGIAPVIAPIIGSHRPPRSSWA